MRATLHVRRLCRRCGRWLLRFGEAGPTDWQQLREVEVESMSLLRTRRHLWRRIARELGHPSLHEGTTL